MKAKGVIDRIIEDINKGTPREELEKKYNKGTITKAYKKLQIEINEPKENQNNKESEIEKLFRDIFKLVDINNEYEIKINISKKTINFKSEKQEKKIIKEVENPFDIIFQLGEDEYLTKLKKRKRDELIDIIKKYFSMNKKNMNKLTKEELGNYIIVETKKVLNIGECFK